ncbi:MAG: hypothetical protein K1X64_07845 [Myxococcaceae bacterium]|nr:hypothetical protein [Myxococcaceae bacterium]
MIARFSVLALLLAAPVLAAPKPKVVIDGPASVRALVNKILMKKYRPVPPGKPVSDEPTANEVTDITRKAGAKALVICRIEGKLITVQVLDGYDGSPLSSFRFKAPDGKRKLKALPKGSDKRVEEGLRSARGPQAKKAEPSPDELAADDKQPGKEKEPEKEKEKEAQSPPPPPPTKRERAEEKRRAEREAREAREEEEARVRKEKEEPEQPAEETVAAPKLRLGVTARAFTRRFFYRTDLFNQLMRYELPIGPAAGAEIDFYPAAFISNGFGSRIGVLTSFDTAFGIASVSTNPTTMVQSRYNTSALRFKLGVTVRFNVGPLELSPILGYALQNYSITAPATAEPINVPAVSYNAFRLGGNARFAFIDKMAVQLGIAYQQPLSTGEIGGPKYFPRLSVQGMDAWLSVSYAITKNFEAKVGIDYTRYGYKMNPQPGDPYVAGGALDDYKGMGVVLSYML